MRTANIQATAFRARLYDPEGARVRNFDETIGNEDIVSSMAHPETEIRVNEFYSKKRKYDFGYDNYAKVTVTNPLWGSATFDMDLRHETTSPYEKSPFFAPIKEMQLLTDRSNQLEILEEKAIATRIFNMAKVRMSNYYIGVNDIYPPAIFQSMLKEKPDHGFSQKRINEIMHYIEAKTLPIVKNGLKSISKA